MHFLPQVDYIYCIDRGRIAEHGTYTDLMSRQGAFAALLKEFGGGAELDREDKDEKEAEAIEGKAGEIVPAEAPKAKALMQEEERALGSVSIKGKVVSKLAFRP